MHRKFIVLLTIALAALGLAVGLIASPAHADGPVQLADLPGLGYTLGIRADLSLQPICSNYWVLSGNGAPETLIGDPAHAYCQTPAEMQARIDALLASFPPPAPAPVTTDAPAAPAAPAVTTTAAPTDTAPVATTADPAPADQPVTVPAETQATVTDAPVSTASQDALVAAQDSGVPADAAALAARSAGENALLGL